MTSALSAGKQASSNLPRLPYSSFQAIAKNRRQRPLVLAGVSELAEKTCRCLDQPPLFFLDAKPEHWRDQGVTADIRPFEFLADPDCPPCYVVICAHDYLQTAERLMALGLGLETDFAVTPILNDMRLIEELEQHEARLLFLSGAAESEDPQLGGGLYELSVGASWSYRKLLSGRFHGVAQRDGHFLLTENRQGLLQVDADWQVTRTIPFPPRSRPHGIAVHRPSGRVYVAATYLDAIWVFDAALKKIDEISLSGKKTARGCAHHCNDLCIADNSLYVSMFSLSGNWQRDIFDGGVLEISLDSHEILGPVITDLWMPHNVSIHDGGLAALDSLRGRFLRSNAQVAGEFAGFLRGLDYDGVYFYLGQSRHRNYQKALHFSKNISFDTAIIIFDAVNKVSRSLPLPFRLADIHAIHALPETA